MNELQRRDITSQAAIDRSGLGGIGPYKSDERLAIERLERKLDDMVLMLKAHLESQKNNP